MKYIITTCFLLSMTVLYGQYMDCPPHGPSSGSGTTFFSYRSHNANRVIGDVIIPYIDDESEQVLCSDDATITLEPDIYPQDYLTANWSNGDTGLSITVNTPGTVCLSIHFGDGVSTDVIDDICWGSNVTVDTISTGGKPAGGLVLTFCYDILPCPEEVPDILITDCPDYTEINTGEDIVVHVAEYYEGYAQLYLLADGETGVIVAVSEELGIFRNVADGFYVVYAYHYDLGNPPPALPATGDNVSYFQGGGHLGIFSTDVSCVLVAPICIPGAACNPAIPTAYYDASCNCVVTGCTDMLACNYDPMATMNDDNCEYMSCQGCTDPAAHNFNPLATIDDDSCMSCTDGIQNGDEIAVDCGGSTCPPCPCMSSYSFVVEPTPSNVPPTFVSNSDCAAPFYNMDLDFYIYTENGMTAEAPPGYDPLVHVSGSSISRPTNNPDLILGTAGLGSWWNTGICDALTLPETYAVTNNTPAPIVISYFILPWQYEPFNGYNNIALTSCDWLRYDVTILPDEPDCPEIYHVSGPVPQGTYDAKVEVYSDGIVTGADVIFRGEICVTMRPGFEVPLGTNFVAEIGLCNGIASKNALSDGDKDSSKFSKQNKKKTNDLRKR